MVARPGKIEVTVAATANEKIADAYARHMILFGRLANGESRRVIGALDARLFPELLGMTESALTALRDRSPAVFRRKAYTRLMQRAKRAIASGFRTVQSDFAQELYRICQAEAQFSINVMGRAVPFDFRARLPSLERFREIVNRTPINGHVLGRRFELLAGNSLARYEQAVNEGLRAGESAASITSRVRGTARTRYRDGVLGRVRQWTETEVKTAVDHVGNGTRQAVHEANDNVVKMVVWRAVLDSRTCPGCAALDGQQFAAKRAQTPPLHERCRCWLDPVLKSAKEMGLKPGDLPPFERQSMTGKVPGATTFAGYMKKQPRAFQDEVLGKTRAGLWRSGRVKLDRFVDDRYNILNLGELARREGISVPSIAKSVARKSATKVATKTVPARATVMPHVRGNIAEAKKAWGFRANVEKYQAAHLEVEKETSILKMLKDRKMSRMTIESAEKRVQSAIAARESTIPGLREYGSKKIAELKAELGSQFHVVNPDSVDALIHASDFASVPQRIRLALKDAGVKIEISDLSAAEAFGSHIRLAGHAGKTPRGYPSGSTYANCGGYYSPSRKHVAAGLDAMHGSSTLVHEVGHAAHYLFVSKSEIKDWMNLWARKGGSNGQWLNPYFMQNAITERGFRAGGEEAFAELFGWTITRKSSEIVKSWGKEAADWMKRFVEKTGAKR